MFKRLFIFTLLSSNIITSFANTHSTYNIYEPSVQVTNYDQTSSILTSIFDGTQHLIGGEFFFLAADMASFFDALNPGAIDLEEINAKLDEINKKIDNLSLYAHQIGQTQYLDEQNKFYDIGYHINNTFKNIKNSNIYSDSVKTQAADWANQLTKQETPLHWIREADMVNQQFREGSISKYLSDFYNDGSSVANSFVQIENQFKAVAGSGGLLFNQTFNNADAGTNIQNLVTYNKTITDYYKLAANMVQQLYILDVIATCDGIAVPDADGEVSGAASDRVQKITKLAQNTLNALYQEFLSVYDAKNLGDKHFPFIISMVNDSNLQFPADKPSYDHTYQGEKVPAINVTVSWPSEEWNHMLFGKASGSNTIWNVNQKITAFRFDEEYNQDKCYGRGADLDCRYYWIHSTVKDANTNQNFYLDKNYSIWDVIHITYNSGDYRVRDDSINVSDPSVAIPYEFSSHGCTHHLEQINLDTKIIFP